MSGVWCLLFFIVSLLLLVSLAHHQEENNFNSRCPPFDCGDLGNLTFPFSSETRPGCGLLRVVDCKEKYSRILLGKDGPSFYVAGISQDNSLTLIDKKDVSDNPNQPCNGSLKNFTVPSSPFFSFEILQPQLTFKCPRQTSPANFTPQCLSDSDHSVGYFNISRVPPDCERILLWTNNTQNGIEVHNLYTGWFRVQVNVTEECKECNWGRGQCQTDSKGKFYCANARPVTEAAGNGHMGLGLIVGITAAGIGMLILLALCFRKMLLSDNSMIFLKKRSDNYHNIEAFLKNHGTLGPKRYNYSDIKKMTNSLKHKLGQGGFGGVYKGKLLDGRDVAVKILKEAKGSGEEFINEVASISRTSHVNIVTLLGFCFEGSRRALIYEYVPNGSLDKFIYEKTPLETTNKLKWETLYQIALGIARGLEYLHRGCSTRIFHFDIKPHNILLDEDFCPKISDFGLAKICPQKESVISMTGARGTIGYIAPEVFCRNFGAVSQKSDVYSYGMMVLEMVGRTNNINVDVDCTSELYFPHWIYNHLELDEELELKGIANEDDKERARKMIIVSLWCIQTNPSDRPTMSKVVDMLEGKLSSLQIPPKPFLSSSRSQLALSIYESKCDGAMSRFWSF